MKQTFSVQKTASISNFYSQKENSLNESLLKMKKEFLTQQIQEKVFQFDVNDALNFKNEVDGPLKIQIEEKSRGENVLNCFKLWEWK